MKKSGSLVLLLAAAGCPQLWAAEGVLAADAYVSTNAPNSNFGALPTLNVGGGSTAFIRFDLSALPPGTTSASIASAELIVYVNRVGVAGHVDLHTVTASWTESGLTSASSAINPTAFATVPVAAANNFIAIDVTDLVKSWTDNVTPNYGIAISAATTDSTTQIFLDSKENLATSHPARLQISTAPSTFITVRASQDLLCQNTMCTYGAVVPNSIVYDSSDYPGLTTPPNPPAQFAPLVNFTKVAAVCPVGYFRVSAVYAITPSIHTVQTTIYYPPYSLTEIDFVAGGTLQQAEKVTVGGTILCMSGITLI